MIRGGYTLSRERLTYDDREPDAYDWQADEVDPREKWVLRRYDTIVRTFDLILFGTGPGDILRREVGEAGTMPDPDFDWHDYVLYAEQLHARWLLAQPEQLFPTPLPGTRKSVLIRALLPL